MWGCEHGDGCFYKREAQRGHVGHTIEEHQTGDQGEKGPAQTGVSVSAASERPAWKAGCGAAEVSDGGVRARVFLASAWVQEVERAEAKCGVLDDEAAEECGTGCEGGGGVAKEGVGGGGDLGVRVGEGRGGVGGEVGGCGEREGANFSIYI